jgi:hypothetical protein
VCRRKDGQVWVGPGGAGGGKGGSSVVAAAATISTTTTTPTTGDGHHFGGGGGGGGGGGANRGGGSGGHGGGGVGAAHAWRRVGGLAPAPASHHLVSLEVANGLRGSPMPAADPRFGQVAARQRAATAAQGDDAGGSSSGARGGAGGGDGGVVHRPQCLSTETTPEGAPSADCNCSGWRLGPGDDFSSSEMAQLDGDLAAWVRAADDPAAGGLGRPVSSGNTKGESAQAK